MNTITEIKKKTCEWTHLRIYEDEYVYLMECCPDSSKIGITIPHHNNLCPNCKNEIVEVTE